MKPKKGLKKSQCDAIEDLKKQLRVARGKGNFKEVADIHNQLGNTLRLLGQFDEALDQHKNEVEVCKNYNKKDIMGLGIAYRNIGEVYIDMKEEDKAIPNIKMYLKLAQEQRNTIEEQRALITLGRTYLCKAEADENDDGRNKNIDLGESYFRRAYKLIEESNLKEELNNERELMTMKCNNCQNLGLALEMRGKFNDAVVWLFKAVDIGKKHNLYEYLHPCNTVLCGIYLKLGNYNEALCAVKEAILAAKAEGSMQMEIESLFLQAKTLFFLNEIDCGKKILKKLRKKIIGKPCFADLKEELEPILISAIKICRSLDQIYTTDESNYKKLMELYEEIGDNYANLTCFSQAVEHYLKSVEFANGCGIFDGKKLSRLYFSIAETYKDKGDYLNALKYYGKEMVFYEGNPVEQFKTQTNITFVLEKTGEPANEIIKAHNLAIELAQATKNVKKEATAYQNLSFYLKTLNRNEESDKLATIVDKIKKDNKISDLDEEEENSQNDLDEEIDLNNLSSEEESVEEDDDKKNKISCGKRKKVSQRKNEAGETQLHLAAKRGELKAIQKLLRQGHEVNVRDTAGWTPLHEAANFGHTECVAELVKHGAKVNDAGGRECEGITPLHDALGNGHFAVATILLDHGANPLALDKHRNLPIDQLAMWRHSGEEIDEESITEYRKIKHRLKGLMEKSGHPYSKEAEERVIRKSKKPRNPKGPEFSILKSTKGNKYGVYDEDEQIPVRIAGDDFDPDDPDEATEHYKNAMQGLLRNKTKGRRTEQSRKNEEQPKRVISPGPRDALIPASLDVHEDWMEDDIAHGTRNATGCGKRKRNIAEEVTSRMEERCRRRRRSISTDQSTTSMRISNERRSRVVLESEDELMDLIEPEENSNSSESLSSGVTPAFDSEVIFPPDFDSDLELRGGEEDSFFPSQIPTGQQEVVFGQESVDEPDVIIESSSGSEGESKERKKESCRKTFSSISETVWKQNPKLPRTTFFKNKISIQTRLPFKKTSREKENSDNEIFSLPRIPSNSSLGGERSESSGNIGRRDSLSQTAGSTSRQDGSSGRPADVLRLKIRVLEHVLLVPVDSQQSNQQIEWLCEECAGRYLRSYGVKPILTLSTRDGAQLSNSDPISLVLGVGSRDLELVANVISYDLPPLTQRYQTACVELIIEMDEDIHSAMNSCESSNVLNLVDCTIRNTCARALFQSLQRQHTLAQLIISGCLLFDEGLKELCKILPTLPSLTGLDLSSNGITTIGFSSLVEVFTKESIYSRGPVGLTTLNLSHNPLGSRVSLQFSKLLDSLPNLRSLNLADCSLTENLFLIARQEIASALENSRLEEVNVAYNNFGEIGIEKLFQSLNPCRLKILNCSSVGLKTGEDRFARLLASFIRRNEDCCYLKELHLSDCGLCDKSLTFLLLEFSRLINLEYLDMSNNELLTIVCLEEILTQCQAYHTPLKRLDLGSCPSMWDRPIAPERILLALETKLGSDRKIMYLKLTTDGPLSHEKEDEEEPLSALENRINVLWEEYAGGLTFSLKKEASSITYEYE